MTNAIMLRAYSVKSLRAHKESKHEGMRYPCDKCEYAATTASNLRKHIESKHAEVRYFCNKCEYAVIQVFTLKRPKHEVVRYLYTINANMVQLQQAILSRTLRVNMRYPCDTCEYGATTAEGLKIHIEIKHEGVRYPFDKCE